MWSAVTFAALAGFAAAHSTTEAPGSSNIAYSSTPASGAPPPGDASYQPMQLPPGDATYQPLQPPPGNVPNQPAGNVPNQPVGNVPNQPAGSVPYQPPPPAATPVQPPVPTSPATPATPACPAPGSTSADGRICCNPATQYPDGQKCMQTDGCWYLVNVPPGVQSPPACPAPGSTSADGQYSCNPAHQYPDGQKCVLTNGCYYLSKTPSPPVPTASAPACPSAGSMSTDGRYSCNPAHQYPDGQKCVETNGCYYLSKTPSPPVPTATAPACPSAGSTSTDGRYSCNPAHQYPDGQKCVETNGCYYLVQVPPPNYSSTPTPPNKSTPNYPPYQPGTHWNQTTPAPPAPTGTVPGGKPGLTTYAGTASTLKISGSLALAFIVAALLY